MTTLSRRLLLGSLAAVPLARPGIIHAQSTSKPVRLGLLSDLNGPYRDIGGPGNRVACELAIADFGGEVLGRKIETLQADEQNKPDLAVSIGRQWLDDGVDALTDGSASSTGLATQALATEKKRIYMATGPASSDFTGKLCSPYGLHFAYDTYALAKGTGTAVTRSGGKTWFFITADYAFGHALERDTTAAIKANGGKVLGSVKAPLGTADFSAFLLQAQTSGAEVIGFANAGTDLQNCLKQAAEFGISKSGAKMATLLMAINDVNSLGQGVCAGLIYTDSFYWDMNPGTRAFAKRWSEKMGGMIPGLLHAANYCATNHWLKAIKAVGSTNAEQVMAKMKATPINDFYNKNVEVREDGCVMHEMHLWKVKPASESKYKYDFCTLVADIAPKDAWRPLKDGGCPYIKA